MNDLVQLSLNELIYALFERKSLKAADKLEAQILADALGENCPDWVLVICGNNEEYAGANLEYPEHAAKLAAAYFRVWVLDIIEGMVEDEEEA